MTALRLPALFMRGGTSKAVVLREETLPPAGPERDGAFLKIMGSPDPYGRQLNGMGGGLSSLSKICILARSAHPEADVDYTFAQVPIGAGAVDYSGNCGNMSAAMGPAALEFGLLPLPPDGMCKIRILNTNTSRIMHAHFPVKGGILDPEGSFAIDGVGGTTAPVRLDFLAPGGARTGKLLPTGALCDWLNLPDGSEVQASCIDAANPCVFVRARDLGLRGTELPAEIESQPKLLERLEQIRQAASVRMGLAPDLQSAARLGSVPKVAMIAPPQNMTTLSGDEVSAERQSLLIRMLSMGQAHRATPVTGAVCLAVAARLPGSLPAEMVAKGAEVITIAHPSGLLDVDAQVDHASDPARAYAVHGTVYRSARLLFKGEVCV